MNDLLVFSFVLNLLLELFITSTCGSHLKALSPQKRLLTNKHMYMNSLLKLELMAVICVKHKDRNDDARCSPWTLLRSHRVCSRGVCFDSFIDLNDPHSGYSQ